VRVRTFLVTGVSGAGKSTMARQLRAWGHHAVNADGDSELCGWADRDGRAVQRPAHPEVAWLAAHEWRRDPRRLHEIMADADRRGVDTFCLCRAAIYDPGAAAIVRVLPIVAVTRRGRFAVVIVRDGRAEHSPPCDTAVQGVAWAEHVRPS
jgi:hypothetical protein